MCVGPVKTPFTQEEDEWNTIMNTNLRGAWLMSKAVGKRMMAAKREGSIINISSIAGLERGILPGALAYSVSKAGLNQLTKVSFVPSLFLVILISILKEMNMCESSS